MTTHLWRAASTGSQVASFPARKARTRRIVLGSGLAILVGVAVSVMYDGITSDVAPAIPAIQLQGPAPLANWAPPETNAAGLEYSPTVAYARSGPAPLANWAPPETNAAGLEYSPTVAYARSGPAPLANWAPPETNAAGLEYSPTVAYARSELAPTPPTRPGQGAPS